MFDFEKLEVYAKAKKFDAAVSSFLKDAKVSKNKKDQPIFPTVIVMF